MLFSLAIRPTPHGATLCRDAQRFVHTLIHRFCGLQQNLLAKQALGAHSSHSADTLDKNLEKTLENSIYPQS